MFIRTFELSKNALSVWILELFVMSLELLYLSCLRIVVLSVWILELFVMSLGLLELSRNSCVVCRDT